MKPRLIQYPRKTEMYKNAKELMVELWEKRNKIERKRVGT
jgi:hypothetical protein